jgi:hypothetical protein
MFQQLEEMKAIRAHLELQHSSAENSRRLDLPSELCVPRFDDKSEQLRVWEVNLRAREHAIDQREIDVARKLLEIQERERLVEVKYITVKELKDQIHEEFYSWEDDLMHKECNIDSSSKPQYCGAWREDSHLGGRSSIEGMRNARSCGWLQHPSCEPELFVPSFQVS